MNEIKKCSLAGISFTLETDAYAALNEYIASLQNAYRDDPDGEEIVADIEARIAELILSAISADAIVTKPLIMNIIKQLGSAEEIDSEQPDHDPEPRQAETTDPSGNPRIPRRLYRDVQRHKLGGVCAGIANYFDIDPTLVRLAAIAPILTWLFGVMNLFLLHYIEAFMGQLAGLVVLGYIVMWFTIPPASTARQKLEMKGERITTDSIRENVQQATSEERSRTILADIVNVFDTLNLKISATAEAAGVKRSAETTVSILDGSYSLGNDYPFGRRDVDRKPPFSLCDITVKGNEITIAGETFMIKELPKTITKKLTAYGHGYVPWEETITIMISLE